MLHHTTRAAATKFTPRDDTAPFASHEAASCLIVREKYSVRMLPIMISATLSMNAPSATYCAGFAIHSVKPLRICSTSATQITGNSRLSEVYGISVNHPSSLRQMMRMKPTTSAVPSAWTVSASGQPHTSVRTEEENCVFPSHSNKAQSSLGCATPCDQR